MRPAAANVDQALVLFALTQPSPNLNLLDRFLVMMAMEEIPVVICFNKADLGRWCHGGGVQKKIYEGAGYEVHFISARTDLGMDQVRELLRRAYDGAGRPFRSREILPYKPDPAEGIHGNRRHQPED